MGNQENPINTELFNAFRELEDYLRLITKIPPKQSVMYFYEKTLSEEHRQEIYKIHDFRNRYLAHGKVARGAPTADVIWVEALKKELEDIKKNKKEIAEKMKKMYKNSERHSFSYELETIFKSRYSDIEKMNSFALQSTLSDKHLSYEDKEKVVRFCEVDNKVHFFASIMKDGKDLRPLYPSVSKIVTQEEFYEFVKLVENIVATNKEEEISVQEEIHNAKSEKLSTTKVELPNPFETENAYLYVAALRVISKNKFVSVSGLAKELETTTILANEIVDWMVAKSFVTQEAKRGVGRMVLISKSAISNIIRENKEAEEKTKPASYKKATFQQVSDNQNTAPTTTTATSTYNYIPSYHTSVDMDNAWGMAAFGVFISILGLLIAWIFNIWTWGYWQWFAGIGGGFFSFGMMFALTGLLGEEFNIKCSISGSIILWVFIVANYILFPIIKTDYRILFGCFSVLELIAGIALTAFASDNGDDNYIFGVFGIITSILLFISGCVFKDWSWGYWQWFIGLVGGALLTTITYLIGCRKYKHFVEYCKPATIALVITIIINFVLALIFKGDYRIIFICYSIIETIAGIVLATKARGCSKLLLFFINIIEVVLTFVLFIIGLVSM